ncbi:MAG: DUF305 domain-containing protein [Bacteroidota bacterium]
MHPSTRRAGLGVLLAVLVLPVAAQTTSTEDLEALYWQRQQEAMSRYTQADVTFMTMMIGHHAQALVMSGMAERNGAGPEVSRLAARIANAQRDEIATMQRWLRDRDLPAPEVRVDGARLWIRGGLDVHSMHSEGGMHDGGDASAMHAGHDMGDSDDMSDGHQGDGMGGHAGHDMGSASAGADGARPGEVDGTALHAGMDGMLTQAQLDRLDAASGTTFDRLFLDFMIDHHAGAVTMVETLFDADGTGQDEAAFRLASDIQVDQRTEIARMEQMLDALGGPVD